MLIEDTDLTIDEISSLHTIYLKIGKIGKSKFLDILRTQDGPFSTHLFKLVNISDTGELNFREYLRIYSMIAKEGINFSEKAYFVFRLIDRNEDKTITSDSLE